MATISSRLGGLFKKMGLQRPVQVDAQRSMDDAHNDQVESLEQLVAEDDSAATGPASTATSGTGGVLSRLTGGGKRDRAIAELQRGYGEVIDLVHDIRHHMNGQSQRSDRMIELMSNLSESLSALPETNRNQTRILESVQSHLDHQERNGTRLNETLAALTSVTENQGQTMNAIQHQINASQQNDEQMLTSFNAMNQTLHNLSESNRAGIDTYRHISDQAERNERRMEELMRRSNRHMTILTITSWVLAGIATIAAAYAVITVTQVMSN